MIKRVSILCLLMMMAVSAHADGNKAYWTDTSGIKLEKLELAVGSEAVIRLVAEVPKGKTLKAYSMTVFYEPAVSATAVASPDSVFPPMNINAADGAISINSFNVNGVTDSSVAIIDVTVKGVSEGTANISVMVANYGASASDEFKPTVLPLPVIVK